jgi:hypothetical protein
MIDGPTQTRIILYRQKKGIIMPTVEGAKSLMHYLDLKPTSGSVELIDNEYHVLVHNKTSRWIFSGKLVDEWQGAKVSYIFNAKIP